MAKRPDKYPVVDPELPRLYSRILEAANVLRRERMAASAIGWATIRTERIESLMRHVQIDEPVLVSLPD